MRRRTIIIFVTLSFFLIMTAAGAGVYIDWLWFSHLGFAGLFQTVLASAWAVRVGSWLFFALFLYFNLAFTQKAIMEMPNLVLRQTLMSTPYGNFLSSKHLRALFIIISVIVSWLATVNVSRDWLTVRLFTSGSNTGLLDPIFAKDMAFYLFSLPFLELLYQYLFRMLIVTTIISGAIYLVVHPPQQLGVRTLFVKRGAFHLSLLLALTFLVRALGYRLQMYGLLYSTRGVVFGAGYTDIHAYLPAYWVLMGLAVLAAAALLFNAKIRSPRIIAGSIAGLIIATILLNGVLPFIVQKFIVEPNEFVREEPYLQHNIKFTQLAYGLDQIEEREFPLTETLSYQELLANEGTISNIRLWDWRTLSDTYRELQGLRQYYSFNDIDTDRYIINGKKRQLMLSARELVVGRLTAPTWVNTRLSYTHGYGVVASPVNAVTAQGLPQLFLRDFPVQGESELQIDRPQIYYGELTDNYVFTNTKTDEFDYPMGESNAVTRYEGTGGIPVGNLLRRVLFALRLGDYRILVSGEISAESRVHFNRTIQKRVQKLMPFLQYDNDPYIVVVDGRLLWMMDAYTVSSSFPYAQPYEGINYIRNAVKVTIDAYNGDVHFYVVQKDEPIIAAYSKIFPGVFRSFEEMPEGLKAHVRYPERLFSLQALVYATYHMENSKVFL